MKIHRTAILVVFFLAMAGVMMGAHHQFAIMLLCAIAYYSLTPKPQKDEKHG